MSEVHDLPQELAHQFIIECHANLDKVKEMLVEHPQLVHAYNQETDESALGAAGHMGNRQIANYLLHHGAKLELATAAMLGMRAEVDRFTEQDPLLATSGGAHGIPVAFHAAMSGDTEIMQTLWDNGAQEQIKQSLFGAVAKGQLEMTRWLLDRGADRGVENYQGITPLDFAVAQGFDEIAALLRQAG